MAEAFEPFGLVIDSKQFDDCPIERPIFSRFQATAERNQDKIAVDDGSLRLTYSDILIAAQDLAIRVEATAPRGSAVGIFLPNNSLFPIAALACLKAGRVCVPIDLNYPPDRNNNIIREAGLAAAIVDVSGEALTLSLCDLPKLDIRKSLGVK